VKTSTGRVVRKRSAASLARGGRLARERAGFIISDADKRIFVAEFASELRDQVLLILTDYRNVDADVKDVPRVVSPRGALASEHRRVEIANRIIDNVKILLNLKFMVSK